MNPKQMFRNSFYSVSEASCQIGKKGNELSNHFGNLLGVISDKANTSSKNKVIRLFILFLFMAFISNAQEYSISLSNCNFGELKEYNKDSIFQQDSTSLLRIIYFERSSGFKADVYYFHVDSLRAGQLNRLSNNQFLTMDSTFNLEVDYKKLETACYISTYPKFRKTDCIEVVLIRFENGTELSLISIDNTLKELLCSNNDFILKSPNFWNMFFQKMEFLKKQSTKKVR
ncbi:MAG: hypothetical protein KA734_09930 [Fluviicola sp.]|nr:hypothetical protein [Fluviicola sp.]